MSAEFSRWRRFVSSYRSALSALSKCNLGSISSFLICPPAAEHSLQRNMKENSRRGLLKTNTKGLACLQEKAQPRPQSLLAIQYGGGRRGKKTLVQSRNHVTDLSTSSGNLFKMAAKIKTERIWVRSLEVGQKTNKMAARQWQS